MLDDIINGAIEEVGISKEPKKKKTTTKKKPITKKPTPKKPTVEKEKKDEPETFIEVTVPETTEQPTPPIDTLFESFMQETQNMDLSAEETEKVTSALSSIRDSFLGIVWNCDPSTCKNKDICPFTSIKKWPKCKPCPLEMAMAKQASKQYYALLEEELHSDIFTIVEINTIRGLIEIELDEFRARMYVQKQGMIIDKPAFSIKETGEVIYVPEENPVYNVMERLTRRKQKLLQNLLLTPEAKARFKIDPNKDRKDRTKEILTKAEEKIQQIKADTDSAKSDTQTE